MFVVSQPKAMLTIVLSLVGFLCGSGALCCGSNKRCKYTQKQGGLASPHHPCSSLPREQAKPEQVRGWQSLGLEGLVFHVEVPKQVQ